MDYETIRKALESEGLTWSEAAEAIGTSASNLMNIASRRTKGAAVAKKLALLIGTPIAIVFPDVPRYAEPDRAAKRLARIAFAQQRLQASTEPTAKTA